jgi:hypothetical protein
MVRASDALLLLPQDAHTEMASASFQADSRVNMLDVMRTIVDNVVAEVFAVHFQAIVQQVHT